MLQVRVHLEDNQSSSVIPPGLWPFQIVKATYVPQVGEVDSYGNPRYPYLNCECRIIAPGDYFGKPLYFRISLSPKAVWKLGETLEGLGLTYRVTDEAGSNVNLDLLWNIDEDTLLVPSYSLEKLDAKFSPTGEIIGTYSLIGAKGTAEVTQSQYISKAVNPQTGQRETRISYQVSRVLPLGVYTGIVQDLPQELLERASEPPTGIKPQATVSDPLRPITRPIIPPSGGTLR